MTYFFTVFSTVFPYSLFIVAYLIGSTPNALIVGRLVKGIDIREHGSGNLGATNAVRILGKKWGLLVVALDALKAALLIIFIFYVFGGRHAIDGAYMTITVFSQDYTIFHPVFYGVVSVVGHVFPIFAGFRGGKAVASSGGLVLALTPIPGLACLVSFYVVMKITGYVSLGSTAAAFTVFILTLVLHMNDTIIVVFYTLLIILILLKHRTNYIRLIKGTEHSFKKKKAE